MFLICIIGPVGSGKTTITKYIINLLGENNCEYVSCDNYFLPNQNDYDIPQAINKNLLYEHIQNLRSYNIIHDAPMYSFKTHTSQNINTMYPKKFIFIEGHMVLELFDKNLFDFVIYIHQPDNICFQRRLKRDTEIREYRDKYNVAKQHFEKTLLNRILYVEPQMKKADLIISNINEFVVVIIFMIINKINGNY